MQRAPAATVGSACAHEAPHAAKPLATHVRRDPFSHDDPVACNDPVARADPSGSGFAITREDPPHAWVRGLFTVVNRD